MISKDKKADHNVIFDRIKYTSAFHQSYLIRRVGIHTLSTIFFNIILEKYFL